MKTGPTTRDEGFTLVEVVIAILLIGGALLTVLAAATSAFSYQDMARQRQTAVGIANQIIEEVRALRFSDVKLGTGSMSGTPHIATGCKKGVPRLVSCTPTSGVNGSGDRLIQNGGVAVNLASPVTVNGVDYAWYLYISQRDATQPYRATVFVDWRWKERDYSTLLQTLINYPVGSSGCVGGGFAIGGPCSSGGLSALGRAGGPTITAQFADTGLSSPPSVEMSLGYAEVQRIYQSSLEALQAQTQISDWSAASASWTTLTSNSSADNDPSTAIPAQSFMDRQPVSPLARSLQQSATYAFTRAWGNNASSQSTLNWRLQAVYYEPAGTGTGTFEGRTRAAVGDATSVADCSEQAPNASSTRLADPMPAGNGTACSGARVRSEGMFLQLRMVTGSGLSEKYLVLLEVQPPWQFWGKIEKGSTAGATSTLTLSQTLTGVKLGGIGVTPSTDGQLALLQLSRSSTWSLVSSPPSPATSETLTLSTYGAAACGQWANSGSNVSWAGLVSRCITYPVYSDWSAESTNPLVYQFGSMQFDGTTLSFRMQVSQCKTNKLDCGLTNVWNLAPPVTVTVTFPALSFSGASTQW